MLVTYIFIVVPYFYQAFNGYSRTLSVPMLSNRNFLKPFLQTKAAICFDTVRANIWIYSEQYRSFKMEENI